jgi:hypothetical protein
MSLLHAIEVCLRMSRIPPSRFGRDSVRDPRLVHDLRRGRQPGQRVEQRVRGHIEILMQAAADRPERIVPRAVLPTVLPTGPNPLTGAEADTLAQAKGLTLRNG